MMTDSPGFPEELRIRLTKPLPGLAVQLKMASMRRIIEGGNMFVPDNSKKGAVLILFYPVKGKYHLVFIKRTEYPGVHSGQISFPGGGKEPGDIDLTDTALRESQEEIGVDRNSVTVLGRLSDLYIPPSNFLVTPVVGYVQKRPGFIPDPVEVDQILEFPLDEFFNPEIRQEKEITVYPAIRLKAPCFYMAGHVIWGATAMILNELLVLLNPEV